MTGMHQIRESMPVVDSRGNHIGTVDRIEDGCEIKLARSDSPDGLHHYIPLDWVAEIGDSVRLNRMSADVIRERS